MNRISLIIKQKFMPIVFILIAFAGSIMIYFYISHLKNSMALEAFSNEVFIAGEEIAKGTVIKEEMIVHQPISKNIFSSNFINDESIIIGYQAKDTILKGEIISREKINGAQESSGPGLRFSSYIPIYKKAATVPVTYWGDISLISDGDKIDVISTYYEKDTGNLKSEIVLSSKEIIIISNQQGQDDKNTGKNSGLAILSTDPVTKGAGSIIYITFYLDEEETGKIFAALEKGNLNIALCSSRILKENESERQ